MTGRKKRREADGWLVAGLHPCPPLQSIQSMLSASPMRCFLSMASKGCAVNIHFVSATVRSRVVLYPSSFCNHQYAHLACWWCILHCGHFQREGRGGNARGGTRRCHNVTEGTCAASMDQVVTLTLRMLLPVLAAMMAVPR